MAPQVLKDLRAHVERTQATLTDPAERDRALSVLERDLTDTLGVIRTYRNDTRLQLEGRDGNGAGTGEA